jgi:hypothetical protein
MISSLSACLLVLLLVMALASEINHRDATALLEPDPFRLDRFLWGEPEIEQ